MNNTNPFDSIEGRLRNIEILLSELKQGLSARPSETPFIFDVKTCKEVTGLAIPTLYRNTSLNLMPHYRQGGKLYFKRDEIYAWMTEKQIQTQVKFQGEVDQKFSDTKKKN